MREHKAKPGMRLAMTCAKTGCSYRHFDDPKWVCPVHGRAVRQENNPYLGQPTT